MNKNLTILIAIAVLLWLVLKNQQPQQVSNEETWEWIDWQGLQRSITVHRNMRQQNGNG